MSQRLCINGELKLLSVGEVKTQYNKKVICAKPETE